MLKGKNAIVTGGSRGIGKAIAIRLAMEGANVAVFATKETKETMDFVKELHTYGIKAVFVSCNVALEEEVKTAVAMVIEAFGSIDILVNNAGITNDKLLMQMKSEDFERVLNVNLLGTFLMIKECIRPFMKQRYGRIINISSVVGMMGNAGQANYAASKAGVIGLTKSIAKEYASRGVTCNAVAPGYISTQMTEALPEATTQAILKQIPIKRLGTPEDVANVVAFLAQEETSYLTGEVIKIDGGMYI